MVTKTTSVKGLVFYINSKGNAYYINSNREHIMIPNGFNTINKDKIAKDLIKRTAKQYTQLWYDRMCGKLYLNNDAVQTMWISLNEYINKDLIFF